MFKSLIMMTVVLLASCTWVKLTKEAEKVRVLSIQEVQGCDLKGTVTVSLKSNIGPVERSKEKVRKELEILARNNAAEMSADTVVAVSAIKDGQQNFDVYRCVR